MSSHTPTVDEARATLGVAPGASKDEVKKAYQDMALLHHPDKNDNSEESTILFQKISASFQVLSKYKEPAPGSAQSPFGPGPERRKPTHYSDSEDSDDGEEEEEYGFDDQAYYQYMFFKMFGRYQGSPAGGSYGHVRGPGSSSYGYNPFAHFPNGRYTAPETEADRKERLRAERERLRAQRQKREEEERAAKLAREQRRAEDAARKEALAHERRTKEATDKVATAFAASKLVHTGQVMRSDVFTAARVGNVARVQSGVDEDSVDVNGPERLEGFLTEAEKRELERDAFDFSKPADAKFEKKPSAMDCVDTLLHIAAKKGFANLVEWLVGRDAAVDVRDADQHTPFHLALATGSAPTIRYFLTKFAPPRPRPSDTAMPSSSYPTPPGETLLSLAVSSGNAEAVRLITPYATSRHAKDAWAYVAEISVGSLASTQWEDVRKAIVQVEGFKAPPGYVKEGGRTAPKEPESKVEDAGGWTFHIAEPRAPRPKFVSAPVVVQPQPPPPPVVEQPRPAPPPSAPVAAPKPEAPDVPKTFKPKPAPIVVEASVVQAAPVRDMPKFSFVKHAEPFVPDFRPRSYPPAVSPASIAPPTAPQVITPPMPRPTPPPTATPPPKKDDSRATKEEPKTHPKRQLCAPNTSAASATAKVATPVAHAVADSQSRLSTPLDTPRTEPGPPAPAGEVYSIANSPPPSAAFLKWCTDSLLGLNVPTEGFIQMCLQFPLDAAGDVLEIISDTVYANSSTLHGRRFAEEFIGRRMRDTEARYPDTFEKAASVEPVKKPLPVKGKAVKVPKPKICRICKEQGHIDRHCPSAPPPAQAPAPSSVVKAPSPVPVAKAPSSASTPKAPSPAPITKAPRPKTTSTPVVKASSPVPIAKAPSPTPIAKPSPPARVQAPPAPVQPAAKAAPAPKEAMPKNAPRPKVCYNCGGDGHVRSDLPPAARAVLSSTPAAVISPSQPVQPIVALAAKPLGINASVGKPAQPVAAPVAKPVQLVAPGPKALTQKALRPAKKAKAVVPPVATNAASTKPATRPTQTPAPAKAKIVQPPSSTTFVPAPAKTFVTAPVAPAQRVYEAPPHIRDAEPQQPVAPAAREPFEGYTHAPAAREPFEGYTPYYQPRYDQPSCDHFSHDPAYGFAPPALPPFDPYANHQYLPLQQSYYQPPEPFYAPSPPPPSTDCRTTFFDAPPHVPSPSPSDLYNGGGYATHAFDSYQARGTPPPPREPRKTGLSSAGMGVLRSNLLSASRVNTALEIRSTSVPSSGASSPAAPLVQPSNVPVNPAYAHLPFPPRHRFPGPPATTSRPSADVLFEAPKVTVQMGGARGGYLGARELGGFTRDRYGHGAA